MVTILVTGGAGYVGSHSVLHFQSLGWRVVVVDNLSTGHMEFANLADRFKEVDLLDSNSLESLLKSESFDGILHCASKALVGESVEKPLDYFETNVVGAMNLVRAAKTCGKIPIVFSSSASVYGIPDKIPVSEETVCNPINPYGVTKMTIERILQSVNVAHNQRFVSLRYFNAAGADPLKRTGERHHPEHHLIPNIINALLSSDEQPEVFSIWGDDYPTRDGTCLRDFIHVMDLANAHALAFEHLWQGGSSEIINLGSGSGLTVREVLNHTINLTGRSAEVQVNARRPGDPPELLADFSKAQKILGWSPLQSDLSTILKTALVWHKKDLLIS